MSLNFLSVNFSLSLSGDCKFNFQLPHSIYSGDLHSWSIEWWIIERTFYQRVWKKTEIPLRRLEQDLNTKKIKLASFFDFIFCWFNPLPVSSRIKEEKRKSMFKFNCLKYFFLHIFLVLYFHSENVTLNFQSTRDTCHVFSEDSKKKFLKRKRMILIKVNI